MRFLAWWFRGYPPPTQPGTPEGPWRESWETLQDGMSADFAFVRVDIVGHSRITRENPSSSVEAVLGDFERHVEYIVARYEARVWNWAGDGGLIAFHEGTQTQKVNDAVAAGFLLLESLSSFNKDHPFEQAEDQISVRVAVHCGNARYRVNTGRIHSPAINFVAHLEHERTHPNSISISEPVYRELSRPARSKFVSAGTFEGIPIHTSDTHRRGNFPKRIEEWKAISIPLQVLTEKLRPLSADAVMVGFYRSAAVAAGMLAPNVGIKSVIVLGRERIRDDFEQYARLHESLANESRRVIYISLTLDSADAVLRKLDYFRRCNIQDVVVATMYISPNTRLRLEEAGIDVVFAEERELTSAFFDGLPWMITAKYDHR